MSGETAHPGSASPGGLPPMVRQRLMALATPAHYLSLAVAFGLLLYLERHTWFFNDEFAFFARMQPGHSLDLLVPYQEQWSTVPLLITLGLYKLVGLHSVLPYNLWMLLTHMAVTHLLWRWMRRIGGDPWVATALAAVFLVVGGGVEEFSIWFQVTFEMSVALGLAGAVLVDHDGAGWLRDVGFWPVAVIGLMCSNVGVFMVVLGGLVALLRRGPAAALRVVSVPAAVFVAWLTLIAHGAPSSTPTPLGDLWLLPQYVWTGMTAALDSTTGWTGTGAVLLVALAVWLYRERRQARGPKALAFAAALTAPAFFVGVGITRLAAGTSGAASTRYGYVCVALLLPAAALALSRLCERSAALGRTLVVAASGVWVMNGVAGLIGILQFLSPLTAAGQSASLGAARTPGRGRASCSGRRGQCRAMVTGTHRRHAALTDQGRRLAHGASRDQPGSAERRRLHAGERHSHAAATVCTGTVRPSGVCVARPPRWGRLRLAGLTGRAARSGIELRVCGLGRDRRIAVRGRRRPARLDSRTWDAHRNPGRDALRRRLLPERDRGRHHCPAHASGWDGPYLWRFPDQPGCRPVREQLDACCPPQCPLRPLVACRDPRPFASPALNLWSYAARCEASS